MIIWGTRIKRRKLGRVADFCPICRCFQAFKLIRVGQARHIYFISFGWGKLVRHEMVCETCGSSFPTDCLRYRSVSDNPLAHFDVLAEETHPNLADRYAERLRLEERFCNGTTTMQDRAELIREAFVAIAYRIEERAAEGHIDIYTGLAPLLTIAMTAAVVFGYGFVADQSDPEIWDTMIVVVYGALSLGCAATLVLLATDVRRFIRSKIHPVLVAALQPLQPSVEELQAVLTGLKVFGLAVGRKVDAQRLFNDMSESSLMTAGLRLK